MAEELIFLKEDGYLNVDSEIKQIVYHPSLNVILICTGEGIVRVLDVNSGVVLQNSNLSAQNGNEIACQYIPELDRVLFCDGQALGVRSDYNGVLLLDTILQKPTCKPKDSVKLELLLSEAIILKQSLTSAAVTGIDDILNELTEKISEAQECLKIGIKAQKWTTLCLELPLEAFRSATNATVTELIVKNQRTPELGVASAVYERLSELLGEQANASDRRAMASEAKRRETFTNWPHMDYKWALPDQMAQAGFYHQPNVSGKDRAMCFTCTVCLVCWERTDEPWSEHERHSPNCPFVLSEYTENVPLSVTYATSPAADVTHSYRNMVPVNVLGTSSVPHLFATSNSEGLISVYDVTGKVKRTHSFFVTQFDSHVLEKLTQDFGVPSTWCDNNEIKHPAEKQVTALTIVGEKAGAKTTPQHSTTSTIRPSIICGLNVRFSAKSQTCVEEDMEVMVEHHQQVSENGRLYFVVYDFQYVKEPLEVTNTLDGSSKYDATDARVNSKDFIMLEEAENLLLPTTNNNTGGSDIITFISDFKPYNIVKEQVLYQNLIPGESDEIFLPPSTDNIKHSGPRLVDTSASAFDALQYPMSSSPIEKTNSVTDKTISDHIADLKSNRVNKKLNYSRAVQCMSIPENYKCAGDAIASHIVPTDDGRHVLVVVQSPSGTSNGLLLMYALDFSGKMVKVVEQPIMARELSSNENPIEVRLLPQLDRIAKDFSETEVSGTVIAVCSDGSIQLIDLSTLKTVSVAKMDGEKFMSAVYCTSLERLCASTKKGSLHFYALKDNDSDSIEDHDDEDMLGLSIDSQLAGSHPTESSSGSEMPYYFHESVGDIKLEDLRRLQSLCLFEPIKVGYCAVVPPCWSEMQQAQRQRRHPHIQTENEQHTKTWRLQTDTTTWDEHVFELTLPSPTCVGHVDVHFALHGSSVLPHVEITLLKQNTNSIGHRKNVKFGVDDAITFEALQWANNNPVTSQEYLRAHKADILAGPVDIATSLDLTDQGGCVTLTSPRLFKSRVRTLLLHIKSVFVKEEGGTRFANATRSRRVASGVSAAAGGSSLSSNKGEFYMGCDCLQEVSVTVYTVKHVDISNEKMQRSAMLESNVFVQSLVTIVTAGGSYRDRQSRAMDILNWIAAIRMTRNRSCNGEPPNQQIEFLKIVETNLPGLLRQCLLLANRSISHKCAKLMIICSNGARNMNEQIGKRFDSCILSVLLVILESIDRVQSASSLQWIVNLLFKVAQPDQCAHITSKCVSLLSKLSEEIHARTNPYHLLLRSRYGLYGIPLEPELFDIEPPPSVKATSVAVTYASVVAGDTSAIPSTDFHTNFTCNKETLDPKEVLSVSKGDNKIKLKNVASTKMIRGLLETEPLHFTCVSASEGTRLERADSNGNNFVNSIIPIPVSGTQPSVNSGTKKVEVETFMSEPEAIYVHNPGKEASNGQGSSNNSNASFFDGFCNMILYTDNLKTDEFSKIKMSKSNLLFVSHTSFTVVRKAALLGQLHRRHIKKHVLFVVHVCVSARQAVRLERLCASTKKGSLHFYALKDNDSDSIEDHDDEDMLGLSIDSQLAGSHPTESSSGSEMPYYFHESVGDIKLEDLRRLQSLCLFEPIKVGYCAVVPPCWSEMQQAQRQRRHPHIQTENEQHTKTWRLQTDTTTWDEHVFELTLPSPTCVGHVDVHFALHGSSVLPHVEITLLKQNTNSIGHRKNVKFGVDDAITFEALQWANNNPVTSQEYLRAHKADILAGPVDIATSLDLTDQGGCVTLTSPRLFKSRVRTLLLHIKSVFVKEEGGTRFANATRSRRVASGVSAAAGGSSLSSNKGEFYMGCDCLQEVSVTVYTVKHVDISNEKMQRSAMLESNVFVQSLVTIVTAGGSYRDRQSRAMDILNWIAAIRMTRNRSCNGEPPNQQIEFLKIVETNLPGLLRQCLLLANRSISHKCAKLMIICSNGARNMNEQIGKRFDSCILSVLLVILESIDRVQSASSLQWIVNLLFKVAQPDQCAHITSKCVSLLSKLSEEIHARTNPYHLLLRSRYGLYGIPLEPELFDIEPPPSVKATSVAVTYASVVAGDTSAIPSTDFHTNFTCNKETLDPKEVLSVSKGDNKIKLKNVASTKMIRGLLETEPLHFTCVSASEGTRLERADSNGNNFVNSIIPIPVSGTQPSVNSGTKKVEVETFMSEPEAIYVHNPGKEASNGQGSSNNSNASFFDGFCNMILYTDNLKTDEFSKIKMITDTTWEISVDSDSSSINSETNKPVFGVDQILSPPQTLPWQQLLITPPQQVIIVERMHSGARRFVTLDFGQMVLLTDILIPACHDLVSLSVDVWVKSEDVDAVRLVVASDINTKNLILSDLQPQPLCRYLKITAVGRYGMSTTRCRIPIGSFFGHLVTTHLTNKEHEECQKSTCTELENQLGVLSMLLEDVGCRYSLASTKLKNFLQPFLNSNVSNASHFATYMSIMKENEPGSCTLGGGEVSKIITAYQEAVTYQRQLNTVRSVMRRIEDMLHPVNNPLTNVKSLNHVVSDDKSDASQPALKLSSTSTDKLCCIVEALLDSLLSIDSTAEINLDTCQKLFSGLCVAQNSRIQLLGATLLLRSCGKQPFWDSFIADTLKNMFSSSCTYVFPQDRLFVLLAFLGRKSPDRSSVVDATLRVIAEVLVPLAENRQNLLAVSIDCPLLGWLLLFLSLLLDMNKGMLPNATRWDWVTGEIAGKTNDTSGSSYKKKLQKTYLYKQQLKNLDWTQKVCHTSTQVQALSALSSQAAHLTSKLEAALKQQEHIFKKMKHYKVLKDASKSLTDSDNNGSSKQTKRRREPSQPQENKQWSSLPSQQLDCIHCLVVAKCLISLLLSVDHSCSADMFLLSCKVIARLISLARLRLGQLMNEDHLLKLVKICIGSELPWAPHALACLLQDALEVTKPTSSETDMETDNPSTNAWTPSDLITDVESLCESFIFDDGFIFEPASKQGKTTNNNENTSSANSNVNNVTANPNNGSNSAGASGNNNAGGSQLTYVYESDDSELEDFLDDILERGRNLLKRSSKSSHPSLATSSAMDARLEHNVEMSAEIALRQLTIATTCNLVQNVSASVPQGELQKETTVWPTRLTTPWQIHPQSSATNRYLLISCFNSLFRDLHSQSPANMENVLQLWLTLNCVRPDDKFDPSVMPFVGLSGDAVNALVSAIAWSPGLSLRTWCSALQTLTLVCNMTHNETGTSPNQWSDPYGLYAMTQCIVGHPDFTQMLLRLLSGSGLVFSEKGLAGPSLCKTLHDFLVRLQMRCNVVSPSSHPGSNLKSLLLKIVYQLIQPNGPLAARQGPLDAQCKLLQSMGYLDYSNADLSIAMSIFESTGILAHSYISHVERIRCVNIGERLNPTSHLFSGILASVLGSESNKQDRPVSWDFLLISLLKLQAKLVQTPLPGTNEQSEAMDTEPVVTSQTDESKAEQIQQEKSGPTVPCLADTVLQHHPSIIRLCQCLAACKASSLSMLANISQQSAFTDLGEPGTVGDAVFHVLAALAKKASNKELVLEPVLMFLVQAPQLSEPLLWFILQVIDTEDALRSFLNSGKHFFFVCEPHFFYGLTDTTWEISVDSDSSSINSETNKPVFGVDQILSPPQTLPWQQLLITPPQQVIIVERMHSGARRFVTLDFGQMVLLTDILIPACHDLVSLSVDVWVKSEDVDAVRLVVASDINTKNLILSDLQPQPLCRYLKITAVGRYGMSTTRCRIPIGSFFGHLVTTHLTNKEHEECQKSTCTELENQLGVLSMLLEDVGCRYSLASTKLKNFLQPFLNSNVSNASHFATYMSIMKENEPGSCTLGGGEVSKIITAYQEAVTYQRQLNTVRSVMRRIEDMLHPVNNPLTNVKSLNHVVSDDKSDASQPALKLSSTSTDKLCCIVEALLDSLLSIDSTAEINLDTCQKLFSGLCVAQNSRIQLLGATLLLRSCGKQPFWDSFIADTLKNMFSSSCTYVFPQDRLFVLLAFLGRKSPDRSSVVDATLRVIAEVLVPLAENRQNLLAVSIDCPLLGWLLLFLSLLLDMNKGMLPNATRWDWVTGEIAGKTNDTSGSSYKKKLQKTYLYKQQLKNLDWTQKVCHTSTQALSALSSQAAHLTSKLEAALKQQEHIFKKMKHYKVLKDASKSLTDSDNNGSSKQTKRRREPSQPQENKQWSSLPSQQLDCIHCLVVAKCLISLLLSVDHSCSADMFLLSCKVIARLISLARLRLGQLMNEDHLLKLVKICIGSELPWAPHALACLLQDALEVTKPTSSETDMETDNPSTNAWTPSDLITDVESLCESFIFDDGFIFEPASKQGKTTNNNENTSSANSNVNNVTANPNNGSNSAGASGNNNAGGSQLTYVYESDDSELEDFLDDILERGRNLLKRSSKSSHPSLATSSAMDARLEHNVEMSAEIALRQLTIATTCNLVQNVSASVPQGELQKETTVWPTRLTTPWQIHPQSSATNRYLLISCFNSLFRDLHSQSPANMENVLQLWLTLNCVRPDDKFDPSVMPFVGLSGDAVNALVSAIAWSPGLSLRTWCSALQTLTLVCNMTHNETGTSPNQWSDPYGLYAMTQCIVGHPDFTQMLLRLLSGSGLVFSEKGLAGPSLCKTLHDFLVRLQMRCNVVSPSSHPGSNLKSLLLKIVYQLIQPNGPLAARQGPLDAQCKLLQSMGYLDYSNADLSIAMSIFESTGILAHSYISHVERIRCVNIGERLNPTSHLFSGILASVLGSESNKQDRPVSWDFLLISLLKLQAKLVQTPLPGTNEQSEAMDTEPVVTSQTDESKAEQIQQEKSGPTVPCLADTVLQHHPSIIRLCQCLAACKASSLSMLANISQQSAFTDLGEPGTVGDAVFHVLAALAKKASNKELVLEPVLMFLVQAPQLSEPLLWFILQVIDTEDALRSFLNSGGIRILAQSLVQSSNAPNTISHTGTISAVMQHFGSTTRSDASTAIAAASATKKLQQATLENTMSLVNFAPFGTIKCQSGTAQSADVLIQGGAAAHRRARTPQWSYHFYPEEIHTELLIQLPSAILLREVHLQPHLSSLATCPSAVALEVSSDGPSRLVPACPPLPTSGMTFIRFHLPVPEVVNCIQLCLYKPRDANNIGLSQIRILGTSAFGGHFKQLQQIDLSDDESHCKYSLGWLRLLHHCFTLASDSNLKRQVVTSAVEVPNLLSVCCGLLIMPTNIPILYLPNLESVLCEMSLHDRENGLNVIRILLNSKPNGNEVFTGVNWGRGVMLVNSAGVQSACELLNQICGHQDSETAFRVALLLEWVKSVCEQAIATTKTDVCNAAYLSSIASILWTTYQSRTSYNITSLITLNLFDSLYNLLAVVQGSTPLKYALDSLLCSLCYIKLELFPTLLQRMGVLIPNLSTDHGASISDDRKDSESMTDDTKQTFECDSEWYGRLIIGDLSTLNLTESQLETIALVSRSPTTIQQLLDSGLPKLLNTAILQFCSSSYNFAYPMARLENVATILKFFADVSEEKIMRDWLGSKDGSSFWLPLLQWLCRTAQSKKSNVKSETLTQLEEICIRFLSKCSICHPNNQAHLAKILCEVIAQQTNGISGFMRRLILQLLLENEKVPVTIKADETIYRNTYYYTPVHPAFKQTHNQAFLYLGTNITLAEILEQHVSFSTLVDTDVLGGTNGNKRDSTGGKCETSKGWWHMVDSDLSMAAGVTAKDKRAKDAKNQATATPQLKKKRYTNADIATHPNVFEGRIIRCEALPERALPVNMTLGQVLRLIETKGVKTDWPCVRLIIAKSTGNEDKNNKNENNPIVCQSSYSSTLQVFSSVGGLALLAQHLPAIYPESIRTTNTKKQIVEQSESDWVKLEGSDDIYEDIEETASSSTPSKTTNVVSNVPTHSLTAFGLFLRLPGYAEVLLKDLKKALCLLRLVLGVTDDGEGGDIFQSPIADSLPTLPFEVLRKLYDATPLSTDDGRLLRRISISAGVVHLLLACLGIFTHQTQNIVDKDGNKEKLKEEKSSQLYWAKGTGYGTGSTQQSWNVEQALLKQRSEEEHVTVLLQVLASYINPNGEADDELSDNVLPPAFYQLLANSALIPALSSYLRNDSVLDMARHIPLYKAALQLLRALAASSQLVSLLLPQKNQNNGPSVSMLLKNMKTCVDTYASKLKTAETHKTSKKFNGKSSSGKYKSKMGEQLEELERDEGLAQLMPDIQATANLVTAVTDRLIDSDNELMDTKIEQPLSASIEERYLSIMKKLQFDTFEMIQEIPEGGYKFIVSHHFESNARSAGDQSHPARVKRLAQEAVTLATSLPLSYSSSVFVRCDTDRLDIMKVLITGPADTPYANGCLELDVYFPPDYPLAPMMINLETTGHHTVRFNPNLYNDGKVCLSVLNTWHGRPEEKWNPQTSSFLQVLVSIQSLILVPEPYFNEPGYERSRGTPAGTQSSREYNQNVYQATVRWAMLEQIVNPCPCFRDVIHAHFYLKRDEVIAQVEEWIKDMENSSNEKKSCRNNNKRTVMNTLDSFKKTFEQLKEKLMQLEPPDGLTEDVRRASSTEMATSDSSEAVNTKEEDEEEEEEETSQEHYHQQQQHQDAVEQNEIFGDIDMEKMVNEMCE
ncbi:baculoviral IAP repeat-containing protein 6 [Agrilus planipennis]|uniref:Dual E2 ubiquitin-conjugating enzyme/E3 ubiquitin-protein ligase BIRC6 n=1 Tax=Agrilus planipennis TaxID=224129 RepID=A0A7F5QVP8_AGRPL|nr:baculoviral IAP repeat-containing protein 6 [Agrilus planipennis]